LFYSKSYPLPERAAHSLPTNLELPPEEVGVVALETYLGPGSGEERLTRLRLM